jgi:protoporphyrinogen oxidase|tara:strand:+ start:353 stop:595 length:243 start_codon:yes stop_codon:yes gene_type:complete
MKEAIVTEGVITELSTAWKLPENDYKASVIESEKSFAGLAKTIKIGNYFFDIDQMIRIGFNTAEIIIKQQLRIFMDIKYF